MRTAILAALALSLSTGCGASGDATWSIDPGGSGSATDAGGASALDATTGSPRDGSDAGVADTGGGPRADASGGADAGGPASNDAGAVDLDGGTTVVVIPPGSGTWAPTGPLHGPGLVLMGGGTDVDAAFVWMHDTLVASSSARGGNVVVLRSDDATDNAYTPYIYGLAPFQSVTSIYLGGTAAHGTPATPVDLAIAAYYVDRSDAVFFAGGDQADYVTWRGSALTAAIDRLYARGGVVGGTSAGCAILGGYVFDSVAADLAGNASVATADAVANPFEATVSFTRGTLAFPTLANVLADMHFVTRDRLGRLAAFVARQYADGVAGSGVVGVGVDESNALLVDKDGKATLVQQSGGTEASAGSGAYVVVPSGPAKTCATGKPLVYDGVRVVRLASPGTDSYDFARGCGSGVAFTLDVDGSNAQSPYTPADPYTASGARTTCP